MVEALSEDADVPTQEEPRGPRRPPNPVETLINKGMLPVEPRAADIDVPKQPSWRRAACRPVVEAFDLLSVLRRARTGVLIADRTQHRIEPGIAGNAAAAALAGPGSVASLRARS